MKAEHFGNDYLQALDEIATLQAALEAQSAEIAKLKAMNAALELELSMHRPTVSTVAPKSDKPHACYYCNGTGTDSLGLACDFCMGSGLE